MFKLKKVIRRRLESDPYAYDWKIITLEENEIFREMIYSDYYIVDIKPKPGVQEYRIGFVSVEDDSLKYMFEKFNSDGYEYIGIVNFRTFDLKSFCLFWKKISDTNPEKTVSSRFEDLDE